MKNIKEYLTNNQKIVRGPVNPIEEDEEFNPIEVDNESIGYQTISHKKKVCIVEVIKIGENKFRNLYKITNIIYPTNYPSKLKFDYNVNDIYAEQKIYIPFKSLEKTKKEYDKFYQEINEYRFYPLPELTIAKNWYQELSKEEQKYIQILCKNNAF